MEHTDRDVEGQTALSRLRSGSLTKHFVLFQECGFAAIKYCTSIPVLFVYCSTNTYEYDYGCRVKRAPGHPEN
jgi:hypothetical protein